MKKNKKKIITILLIILGFILIYGIYDYLYVPKFTTDGEECCSCCRKGEEICIDACCKCKKTIFK